MLVSSSIIYEYLFQKRKISDAFFAIVIIFEKLSPRDFILMAVEPEEFCWLFGTSRVLLTFFVAKNWQITEKKPLIDLALKNS